MAALLFKIFLTFSVIFVGEVLSLSKDGCNDDNTKCFEQASSSPLFDLSKTMFSFYRTPVGSSSSSTLPGVEMAQLAREMNGVLKIVPRETVERSSLVACIVCFFEKSRQKLAQSCLKRDTLGRIQMVRSFCPRKKQQGFRRAVSTMLNQGESSVGKNLPTVEGTAIRRRMRMMKANWK